MRRRRPAALVGVVATLLAVALGRAYVMDTVVVSSDSMRPTLCAGDWLLLLTPGAAAAEAGDLVVFRGPDDGEPSVKRVVAVGGQRVEIRDAVLYVDGTVVSERYVDLRTVDGTHFGPAEVPPDGVFVLGDDRERSVDSRTYGPVSRRAIEGRVVARVHSACD